MVAKSHLNCIIDDELYFTAAIFTSQVSIDIDSTNKAAKVLIISYVASPDDVEESSMRATSLGRPHSGDIEEIGMSSSSFSYF